MMKNNLLFHVINSTCCPFLQDHMAKVMELKTRSVNIVFHIWYTSCSLQPSGNFLQELGINENSFYKCVPSYLTAYLFATTGSRIKISISHPRKKERVS